MTGPIDYAALRVQLELRLRALRRGEGQPATEAAILLAEQAVDVGTQELIYKAATVFGLIGSPPEAAATPAAPEAPAPASDAPAPQAGSAPAVSTEPAVPQPPAPDASAPAPGAGS